MTELNSILTMNSLLRNHLAFIIVLILPLVSTHTLNAQQTDAISWEAPTDGGTPRDLGRILKTGDNKFYIRASFEEGGEGILKHAVSRMDLICKNNASNNITITLEIDLSQGGKRTEYDNKPEAGMKYRDFVFIKRPGDTWKQINGYTQGWISIVDIEIPPGSTQIGLSPWYTYSDYISFINALQESPSLKKRMIGKSDGGREHWELTITDPNTSVDKKEKIFWQAREHAYETFSSYAMEGLIPFLLSDEAKGFRQRYVITIHPMTNVDGVANGYEYRTGYDFPEVRKTETAKLTFGAIDRLQPQYAVAWHNWVSPRDRNVVFYTDGDHGQPTPRAWLRFTQLFPSLRSWGHRWKDEDNPVKYNWQNRVVGDHNVHQYAMKHYATKIWGWEMPWWNLSTDEVHKAGAEFARAFLTTLDELNLGSTPTAIQLKEIQVPKFAMHEFDVNATANVSNPWLDAALVGEFTSPTGRKLIVDGFFDGGQSWKLRFKPDEVGRWSYQIRGEGLNVLQQGTLICTAAAGHGKIGIHPLNPYAFAYADSTPFFPMGDTNYGLYDDSPITQKLSADYLKTRRSQNFNFVRMEVGHSYARAKVDQKYWAWGGTTTEPDLDRLNPNFFEGLDSLMIQMKIEGMNAELILLNFYRSPFTDISLWTSRRERVWLHYLLSRYGSFDNIFMWTISNEYETHPDGKYWLDAGGDVRWAKQTAAFIMDNDPYRHLLTIHPVVSSNTRGGNPRSSFDQPWRIGGFFGNDPSLSVISQQTGQWGDGIIWDEKCQCWKGDDPQLTNSISIDRVYNKPVINSEYGYEYLTGQPTMRKQVHHTDKVRRSSWRIVCSGGYFAAGFSGTIGHSDIWNVIDAPNKYNFILKDEGAGKQLSYLYNFFNKLPYWRMQPYKRVSGDAVALADEQEGIVVVYFPKEGTATFEWNDVKSWEGQWFDPRTGEYKGKFKLNGAKSFKLTSPGKGDWVVSMSTE